MRLTDIKEEKLFALFIGRSGSGKTVAAASMPKPLNELDFDLRANGIVNAISQGWLKGDDIDIERFDPFKGFIPVQEYLNKLYTFANLRQLSYKSIDVGSITSLVRLLDLASLNAPNMGHLNIAGLAMTGPADYKFESQSLHKIIDFLRVLPCNVTISAHIIDKYGKRAGAKEMDPQIIVGEKLTITANLAENVLAMFNDVYKFTKELTNGKETYYVEFNSEIAKNSFGVPPGRFEITRKNFYEFFQETITAVKAGTLKPPTTTSTNFLQL